MLLTLFQQPQIDWSGSYENQTGVIFETGTRVAIQPYNGTTRLSVWTEMKRGVWARVRYDNDDPTLSLSRKTIHVIPTLALLKATGMTQTGAWNTPTTTSTTGSTQRHVGNSAIATATAGRKLTQTLTPYDGQAYDLYISRTFRTAGGFCKVSIDGAQTLVNEIGDPQSLGFKAISCYGPVDNTRRQYIKVASGLTGAHTLELECVAGVPTGSSASGTGTVTIEAALISSDLADARTYPAHWASGQTIAIGDEREYGGRYYCSTTTGTTGATPPTHTTSTASDGGVTWSAAGLIYASGWIDVRDVDFASEVEEAIVSLVYNSVSYDIGGQTHGNEFQSNRVIEVDDIAWTWNDAAILTFGTKIDITEDIAWRTAIAGTTLASGTRLTTITAGKFADNKTVTVAPGINFTIASAYGAMLPLTRWDGFWGRETFTQLRLANGTSYNFDDYAQGAVQNLGLIYSAAVSGSMGIAGNVVEAVYCFPVSVNGYIQSGSQAFCNMKQDNVPVPPSGSTDWTAKVYFGRANAVAEAIVPGQVLQFASEHKLAA